MTKYSLANSTSVLLAQLKQNYLQQLIAPIDGMWECFITLADHYSISSEGQVVGYCVINSNKKMLHKDATK